VTRSNSSASKLRVQAKGRGAAARSAPTTGEPDERVKERKKKDQHNQSELQLENI
jgi:hypothetical protein